MIQQQNCVDIFLTHEKTIMYAFWRTAGNSAANFFPSVDIRTILGPGKIVYYFYKLSYIVIL